MIELPQRKDCYCACHDPVDGNDICKHVTACCRPNDKISLTEAVRIARGDLRPPTVPIGFDGDEPNAAHPVTADRFARYEAALREIATIKPSAAGAIAEDALKP